MINVGVATVMNGIQCQEETNISMKLPRLARQLTDIRLPKKWLPCPVNINK
jgi:hypothetical protein